MEKLGGGLTLNVVITNSVCAGSHVSTDEGEERVRLESAHYQASFGHCISISSHGQQGAPHPGLHVPVVCVTAMCIAVP